MRLEKDQLLLAASDCLAKALAAGAVDVAAGTAWAWAREDTEGRVDTLVIDAAGQLSLANALAAATATRSVVLLGSYDTIPPDRGLFLGITWRLHPSICAYTSELFYESRLAPHAQCERQSLIGPTPFSGAGLWLHWAPHEGNTSVSPEEVERIAELVRGLVRPGIRWIGFEGCSRLPAGG